MTTKNLKRVAKQRSNMAEVSEPTAIFALRKSRIRREVLGYLISIYPSRSYASEIARQTRLRATDVCGALNGLSDRFKKENSLVDLNLVEKTEKDNYIFYRATELGARTLNVIRQ
jgi:predicted transcriptional regulator with HTH domain